MPRKKTQKEFIQGLKLRRDDNATFYDYSETIYTGSGNNDKITIICPKHKKFEQLTRVHYYSNGECPSCAREDVGYQNSLTQEEFLKKAIKFHGLFYDYSKSIYKNSMEKITIGCPTHGEFKQKAGNHLRYGCPECGKDRRLEVLSFTEEEFLNIVRKKHNNFYDYSKLNYSCTRDRITIICPEHGEFTMIAGNHIRWPGCPGCKEHAGGWDYSSWIKQAKKSKNFKGFKFYVIRLNEIKVFKLGRTFLSLKKRFHYIPYTIEPISIIHSEDGRKICEIETEFKSLCSPFKVVPDLDFGGKHECFSCIDPIKDLLEELTLTK